MSRPIRWLLLVALALVVVPGAVFGATAEAVRGDARLRATILMQRARIEDANQDNPFHLHSNCEEYLYVVSGSCEHRIGDEWVPIKAGDLVRIPAGVSHRARTRDEPMRAVIAYSAGTRNFTAVDEGL